jgi:hypothetical protein
MPLPFDRHEDLAVGASLPEVTGRRALAGSRCRDSISPSLSPVSTTISSLSSRSSKPARGSPPPAPTPTRSSSAESKPWMQCWSRCILGTSTAPRELVSRPPGSTGTVVVTRSTSGLRTSQHRRWSSWPTSCAESLLEAEITGLGRRFADVGVHLALTKGEKRDVGVGAGQRRRATVGVRGLGRSSQPLEHRRAGGVEQVVLAEFLP